MVKFNVNDVEQDLESTTRLLSRSVKGDQQAKSLAGAKLVEAFSHCTSTFIPNNLGTKNPLLSAVYLSFVNHLPLTLSPDAIWNTIMQGVSTHVSQDPEKHRHTFVSHQGREILSVRDDTLRRGNPNNDWGSIACQITDQISAKLSGKSALQALNMRFTTTDDIARVAHAIVFMDVVKSYFGYRVRTGCGIPSIELTGTKQDWSSLRAALTLLDELDLSPWRAKLDAILAHFEDAFENRIEQTFWNDMFLEHGAFGSGGMTKISGWVGSLFLYVGRRLNPVAMGKSKVRLDPLDFPSGLSETPFVWEYFGEEIAMLFRGGLVGVVIDPVSKTVAPQLGWLVTEDINQATLKTAEKGSPK